MEKQTKPEWITDEQWQANPNIYHWERSRAAMQSLKEMQKLPPQSHEEIVRHHRQMRINAGISTKDFDEMHLENATDSLADLLTALGLPKDEILPKAKDLIKIVLSKRAMNNQDLYSGAITIREITEAVKELNLQAKRLQLLIEANKEIQEEKE